MTAFETLATSSRVRPKRLSAMYGTEVPAYNTLVEVSTEVNQAYLQPARRRSGAAGQHRPGHRGTARRHPCWVRARNGPGGPGLCRLRHVPGGLLRPARRLQAAVPVVSTAFRPVTPMSWPAIRSGSSPQCWRWRTPGSSTEPLQRELAEFFDRGSSSDRSCWSWLTRPPPGTGDSTAPTPRGSWSWRRQPSSSPLRPVDHDWYRRLEAISAVASDIGGVTSTHINHLTPRVLDIDALYAGMEARGITMIDEIQGPPRWDGPDVLLRQTSFRALGEERLFRYADGSVRKGELRVRFGEVEARGIALTPAGTRALRPDGRRSRTPRLAAAPARDRPSVARDGLGGEPAQHRKRAGDPRAGLLHLHGESGRSRLALRPAVTLPELISVDGAAVPEPIVYEDFLPRSAAGIFQSNLTDEGSKERRRAGEPATTCHRMSADYRPPVHDPYELYQRQQDDSSRALRPPSRHHPPPAVTNTPHPLPATNRQEPTMTSTHPDHGAGPRSSRTRSTACGVTKTPNGEEHSHPSPLTGEVLVSLAGHHRRTQTMDQPLRAAHARSSRGARCLHRCAATWSSGGANC